MPKFSKYVEPIQPTCPECVQSVVVKDTREGQNVCTSCGLVLGHRIISDDTEWRTFSESNDKGVDMNRVGGPSHPLLEEEEVGSTQIGKGANNNHILTRNQIRASSGKSQQLFNHYKTIDEINYKLKLSGSVKVITQSIFKQLFDLGEVKGRNKDNLIVACSYIACKLDGVPRTIKELCANSGMRRRDVGRSYLNIQRLQQNGKIKIRRSKGDSLAEKNSHRFVMRFCSVLKLPPKVANKATALSKEAENHSFASGKAPASIAAASILAAADMEHDSNLHKSVEEVAEATHISASTLKQMYKAMQSNANVLLAALEKTKI